jgi:hypothetical protein
MLLPVLRGRAVLVTHAIMSNDVDANNSGRVM